jgi:hypothetical protein
MFQLLLLIFWSCFQPSHSDSRLPLHSTTVIAAVGCWQPAVNNGGVLTRSLQSHIVISGFVKRSALNARLCAPRTRSVTMNPKKWNRFFCLQQTSETIGGFQTVMIEILKTDFGAAAGYYRCFAVFPASKNTNLDYFRVYPPVSKWCFVSYPIFA